MLSNGKKAFLASFLSLCFNCLQTSSLPYDNVTLGSESIYWRWPKTIPMYSKDLAPTSENKSSTNNETNLSEKENFAKSLNSLDSMMAAMNISQILQTLKSLKSPMNISQLSGLENKVTQNNPEQISVPQSAPENTTVMKLNTTQNVINTRTLQSLPVFNTTKLNLTNLLEVSLRVDPKPSNISSETKQPSAYLNEVNSTDSHPNLLNSSKPEAVPIFSSTIPDNKLIDFVSNASILSGSTISIIPPEDNPETCPVKDIEMPKTVTPTTTHVDLSTTDSIQTYKDLIGTYSTTSGCSVVRQPSLFLSLVLLFASLF